MAAPWTEILRNASLGAFQGPNGDYPSVLETVEGLTATQAAWKPSPDRHSIWQIVDHFAKSKERERQTVEGQRPAAPAWDEPSGMTLRGTRRSRRCEPLTRGCLKRSGV